MGVIKKVKSTTNLDLRLRIASIVIASVGLLDSVYLSWVKIINSKVYCGGSNQCETVNNSPFSEIGGIPIAYLGVGAYILIILLLLIEDKGDFWRDNVRLIVFGLSFTGLLYSIYLTYIEVAVLFAICPYCVVSAVAMLFLFLLSIFRLRTGILS